MASPAPAVCDTTTLPLASVTSTHDDPLKDSRRIEPASFNGWDGAGAGSMAAADGASVPELARSVPGASAAAAGAAGLAGVELDAGAAAGAGRGWRVAYQPSAPSAISATSDRPRTSEREARSCVAARTGE